MNNDLPPPISTDDRKTRELCGAERDGTRCMRPKGHEQDEHQGYRASQTFTWKQP